MTADHRLWPGKARPATDLGPQWHPASFHALDVAAVADSLLESNPAWLARLSKSTGIGEPELRRLFARLAALHDIGKLSRSFCEMLGHPLPIDQPQGLNCHLPHWQISYRLLMSSPVDRRARRFIGIDDRFACQQLFAACAGHHGRPPDSDGRFDDKDGAEDALAFIEDMDLLIPGNDALDVDEDLARRLSWSVAGLTVVADWIGSKLAWFEYTTPQVSMTHYWMLARDRATRAVAQAGIGGSSLAPERSLKDLFGIDAPRPMQMRCQQLALTEEPTLVVLEDATGSGKTEAALLLAHRMMTRGMGEGLYVALPTMATANAMFGRLDVAYKRLFDDSARPSIALAHAARHLNERFQQAVETSLLRADPVTLDAGRPTLNSRSDDVEALDVASFCSSWISDDRRKAFLAEVGVGTIDQAFMSILPVKYLVLRQFGLARRILIVDEAHACDPYMEVELARLLEMQAMLGGSAIVMTATMPDRLRSKLLEGFRKGLGACDSYAPRADYPLLTVARRAISDCHCEHVTPFAASRRTVPVVRLETPEAAVEVLATAAAQGACAVWIRNTVDDAINGFEQLEARGVAVELFHARYAMADRLAIEAAVLERFGRESTPAARQGRVLVATQVVEQSLDLDFDLMVSDLAPIDALIQRLGRLWRHPDLRPESSRAAEALRLYVVSPDPEQVHGLDWGRTAFGGSGAVYGVSLLWRTADVLFSIGEIASPDGLTLLIETVVGDRMKELPPLLEGVADKAQGKALAQSAMGQFNAVDPQRGYLESRAQSLDETYPTRADTDSQRAILVTRRGGVLDTWISGDHLGSRSEVSLRNQWLRDILASGAAPAEAGCERVADRPAFARDWPAWRWKHTTFLEVRDDGHVGHATIYDCKFGLRRIPA